ncbi:MAG: type I-B CRISPR-associated protein Cas7/Cst2/DevR, partial [Bacteroidetes bacterium]|nr:type I-B CRISPR-associated protein Cas7/Cst2/DevR [Bacteroidota bacterium]
NRLKRVRDAIRALKTLSGGAKLTTNLTDVTPKLIVLATFKSGNHPFSHLAKEDLGKAVLWIDAFEQVFKDYFEQLEGNIYIGKRAGFMDKLNEDFEQLSIENEQIFYGSINEAINKYVETIKLD